MAGNGWESPGMAENVRMNFSPLGYCVYHFIEYSGRKKTKATLLNEPLGIIPRAESYSPRKWPYYKRRIVSLLPGKKMEWEAWELWKQRCQHTYIYMYVVE